MSRSEARSRGGNSSAISRCSCVTLLCRAALGYAPAAPEWARYGRGARRLSPWAEAAGAGTARACRSPSARFGSSVELVVEQVGDEVRLPAYLGQAVEQSTQRRAIRPR